DHGTRANDLIRGPVCIWHHWFAHRAAYNDATRAADRIRERENRIIDAADDHAASRAHGIAKFKRVHLAREVQRRVGRADVQRAIRLLAKLLHDLRELVDTMA